MFTRIITLLFILSFLSIPAFSQISLEWEMVPQAEGDNLTVPFDQTNVKTNDFRINIGLPIVLAMSDNSEKKEPSLILSNGIFFSAKHLDVNNWPEYSLDAVNQYKLNMKDTYDHLISFGYSATLVKTLSSKWSILGIGGFSYAGINPEKYKVEDIGFIGGLAGIRTWQSGWSFGFGIYYGRLTGADQLLPIISIEKKTEHSTLSISIPSGMTFWYEMNQKVSLGLLAELSGDMYSFVGAKVNQYDKNGHFVSGGNKLGLAYSSVTFGPAVKVNFAKGISMVLRAGMALGRRYEYWLPEKEEILRYSASPDYIDLTGHDYSGEEVEVPIKNAGFIKITFGFGI